MPVILVNDIVACDIHDISIIKLVRYHTQECSIPSHAPGNVFIPREN